MNNIKRFSTNQEVSNTAILLYRMASCCMEYLAPELHGTSYKHGLDNTYIANEHRLPIASLAVELLQEIGLTKEELEQAWNDAQKNREELEEIAKSKETE